MKKQSLLTISALKESITSKIRFSEVDSMAVVWHGNYVHFFEDAREAFGKKYNIGYMDIYTNGYFAPLVSIHCDYKASLKYGDKAIIEATFIDTPAAKIIFRYKILNAGTNELVATGESIQVFTSITDNSLSLNLPLFYEQWKKNVGLQPTDK